MGRISVEQRLLVKQYHEQGMSAYHISQKLTISRGAIRNIVKKLKNGFGVEDLPKSGRKVKLSQTDVRRVIIHSKKFPFDTAPAINRSTGLSKKVSASTIKRILSDKGLPARLAARKPKLNKSQIKRRLEFAKVHNIWTTLDWHKIIFSDECRIELNPKTRSFVRRPKNTRFNPKYISESNKFSPSIMIWGAIRHDGRKVLIRCTTSVDSSEYIRILEEGLPTIYNHRYRLQQDGAPCHRSKATASYLQRKMIRLLDNWPAQSPDVNIIENIWHILKENVKKHHCENLEELWRIIQLEWGNIPSGTIEKCYASLPRRMKAIISNKGRSTKY